MDYRRQFPFSIGTMPYRSWEQIKEESVLADMEYLQQMYPAYAQRYLGMIRDMLNRVDYEGSMIYDQYPDRWQLEQMVRNLMRLIRAEEEKRQSMQVEEEYEQPIAWEYLEPWIKELVTVLLYHEVLTRRQKRKNYYIF